MIWKIWQIASLRALLGEALVPGNKNISNDAIIFAREIGPAELLDYDRDKLRGIVLEEGSASSHTCYSLPRNRNSIDRPCRWGA